jgi:hypothetical protein
MRIASGPETRMMLMPPLPAGVEMAAMVKESSIKKFDRR